MAKGKSHYGTFFAFLAAIISGFSIFINKIFIVDINPVVFTATRSLLIGLMFFILSLHLNKWKLKHFSKVSWKYLILIGIIGGGIAFLLFFSGLRLTTSGRAAFLQKTLPLFVIPLAFVFLKEKINKKHLVALFLMFVGVIAVYSTEIQPTDLWSNPQLGDMLIILATVLWAVENVIARKAMIKGENNFVVSFGRMFFGSLILFAIILISNNVNVLMSTTETQWMYVLMSTAILFMYVLTFYWSINHINVSKAATILLISPVITMILGMTALNEPVPLIQLVGSVLILIGAYLVAGLKSEFSRI